MNWYDADEYCANKGGFLAEPMTSEENNFLLGYAPSLGNVNWWTGNLPSIHTQPQPVLDYKLLLNTSSTVYINQDRIF